MQTTVPALVLRRTYDVPRDRVYAAWTHPEIAKKFLCPNDVTCGEVDMDVRPGGTYRIVMVLENGERWTVTGEYRDLRPPERLSMTWRWQEDDPEDERDTLLILEFNPFGSGTELVLTHERFASEDSRRNHENGWSSILDKIAAAA